MIVMRSIAQFEGRSQLRTWLTRIADNHCYQTGKRRSASAINDHLAFDIALNEQHCYMTAEQAEPSAETSSEVQAVSGRLSNKNQEILRMRFSSEHSLEALSQLLNISLSAAKKFSKYSLRNSHVPSLVKGLLPNTTF